MRLRCLLCAVIAVVLAVTPALAQKKPLNAGRSNLPRIAILDFKETASPDKKTTAVQWRS